MKPFVVVLLAAYSARAQYNAFNQYSNPFQNQFSAGFQGFGSGSNVPFAQPTQTSFSSFPNFNSFQPSSGYAQPAAQNTFNSFAFPFNSNNQYSTQAAAPNNYDVFRAFSYDRQQNFGNIPQPPQQSYQAPVQNSLSSFASDVQHHAGQYQAPQYTPPQPSQFSHPTAPPQYTAPPQPPQYQPAPPPQYQPAQYQPPPQQQYSPQPQYRPQQNQHQPRNAFVNTAQLSYDAAAVNQVAPRSNSVTEKPAIIHPPAAVHYVSIGAKLEGDYKFGYETGKGSNGDQSFREETRDPDGTVRGSYGYVDANGKQITVHYEAGREGFKILSDDEAKNGRKAAPAPQQNAPQVQHAPQAAPTAPPHISIAEPSEADEQTQQRRRYDSVPRSPSANSPPEQQTFGPPVVDVKTLSYNIGVGG